MKGARRAIPFPMANRTAPQERDAATEAYTFFLSARHTRFSFLC